MIPLKLLKKKVVSTRTYKYRIYQDEGHLLLEVDSFDTSKACHECGAVNESLQVGEKEWTCPNCQADLDRDYNASLNIRDWARNIKLHPLHSKSRYGKAIKDTDLLLAY